MISTVAASHYVGMDLLGDVSVQTWLYQSTSRLTWITSWGRRWTYIWGVDSTMRMTVYIVLGRPATGGQRAKARVRSSSRDGGGGRTARPSIVRSERCFGDGELVQLAQLDRVLLMQRFAVLLVLEGESNVVWLSSSTHRAVLSKGLMRRSPELIEYTNKVGIGTSKQSSSASAPIQVQDSSRMIESRQSTFCCIASPELQQSPCRGRPGAGSRLAVEAASGSLRKAENGAQISRVRSSRKADLRQLPAAGCQYSIVIHRDQDKMIVQGYRETTMDSAHAHVDRTVDIKRRAVRSQSLGFLDFSLSL